jgi:hypothetical protein
MDTTGREVLKPALEPKPTFKESAMKKLFVCGMVVLVTLFSGLEVYAAFEMGRLVQVVYKNDDVEVGTDLLDVTTFDFAQQNVQLAPAGTFNLNQFATTNAWGDLSAGFFAHFVESGEGHAWFATTQPFAPAVNSNALGRFFGGAGPTGTYYNGLVQGTTAIGNPSSPSSYWWKMNSHATPGQYAGYNEGYETSPGTGQYVNRGEADLAYLVSIGHVDMYLYHFNLSQLVPGPGGTPYTAVLRLNADGSTVLNPPHPVDLGSAVTGGSAMELGLSFPSYGSSVDIYAAVQVPGYPLLLIDGSNALTTDLVPFRTATQGPASSQIVESFEVCQGGQAILPTGTWVVYGLVVPSTGGNFNAINWAGDYELGYYVFQLNCGN